MSTGHVLYAFEHIIPDAEVCERASQLWSHIVLAGEEPDGLDYTDFTNIAVKIQVTDWINTAIEHRFSLEEPWWKISSEGDVRVILPFRDEEHAKMFRALVL